MKQQSEKFRLRPWARCLFGLGALLAGAAGAEAQTVRTGEMGLELAAGSQLSYIGVDVIELESSLCMVFPNPSTKDPKLVVANDGGHTGRVFGLDVLLATESGGGTQIAVEVSPGSLKLVGPGPFETSCGTWSYRLSLASGATSPTSTLTLVRSRPADAGGAFVGSVRVAAELELTPLAGGPLQLRTYNLDVNLAGTWGIAGASGGRFETSVPVSASNLILFTQQSGLGWVKTAQAASAHSFEDPNPGQLVLQPTDEAMSWLNLPRPR